VRAESRSPHPKQLFNLRDVSDESQMTMMNAAALSQTSLPDMELVKRGKVRDVYAVDDERLLIVATDRISAFDCILPTAIARKGEVLTSLSKFWFEKLADIVPNYDRKGTDARGCAAHGRSQRPLHAGSTN
jgi:phosphoribosylaminoimidazole-succinocarboxamide synthase